MNDASATDCDTMGDVGIVQWADFHSNEPFSFENGQTIPSLSIRYETYGKLNRERTNAILICHALSGDHHCAGIYSLNDKKSGWWDNLIGPGKAVDTNKFFVICSNCLGGCQGSTGPISINPQTGKRYNLDFPLVTIRDMVRAQHRLLTRHLGISELYAIIGGSMGGMQVLQWAVDYPDMCKRIIPMATTARQSTQAIAFNEVGRVAIIQDPEWNNGNYEQGKGPKVGLSVARMMAHITYLSEEGLQEKFGRSRQVEKGETMATSLEIDSAPGAANIFRNAEFAVESYLRHQGKSFINRFDANTYLYFTKALDRFDLSHGAGSFDAALAVVKARTLVVAFTSDWLFPAEQNRNIVHALQRNKKDVSYIELDSSLGHDSFLVHDPVLYDIVRSFLDS